MHRVYPGDVICDWNEMPYYQFFWTDERLGKLALNGVDPDDFEAIVCNPDRLLPSRSTGRPIAFGVDGEGNEIACVYEIGPDGLTVFPITAFYPAC